jgi:broad specificity polyphosphatase/5'/3'-nucleotidase SurE
MFNVNIPFSTTDNQDVCYLRRWEAFRPGRHEQSTQRRQSEDFIVRSQQPRSEASGHVADRVNEEDTEADVDMVVS